MKCLYIIFNEVGTILEDFTEKCNENYEFKHMKPNQTTYVDDIDSLNVSRQI